ncbi:MAG: hypothetical protein WC121_06370 [Candidatus Kapaibacterium sp.]
MQKIKLYSSALILTMIFALSGCPEENDSLVNPPSQAETVDIRFINLAGDNQSRSLRMTEYETPEVAYGQSTETFHPPDDSTKATVLKGGRDEYSPEKQIKFFRKLTYTFFALPTAPGDSLHPLPVDTLIGMNSSLTIPLVTNDAYVRLVNTYSDTNSTFSLVLGCAGGITLAPSVRYRGFSSAEPVLSGENTFSVVYNKNGVNESLGLFRVDMVPRGEYAFVIVKDQSGNPAVYALDEKSPSANAFGPAQEVEAKTTNIRTVNFSSKTFDVNLDADLIVSSPTKDYIGKYNEYTACSGTTISSITAVSGSDTLSNLFTSLEVLREYSLYLFDEGDKIRQVLAPPFKVFGEADGKSIIRVINGNPDYEGITVAFGARKVESENELKYGETIARNVKFGNVSGIGIFESGLSPITVFAATQPAKYITGVNYDLKKDKSYTMLLYKKDDGTPGFTIIEDRDEDKPVSEIEAGVFVQVVNGVAGPGSVRIGIEPLISESANELFYGLNLATVIPIGSTDITVNGKKKTIDIEKGKRLLIVASGTTGDEKILTYQSDPIDKYDNMYKIRFLNASTEIDRITVSRFNLIDCPACPILANNIAYDELSFLQEVKSEAKISLFVYNPDDFARLYHRVDDLKLNFNKAYTVIFTGNSSLGDNSDGDNTNNGYSVVIIQEF